MKIHCYNNRALIINKNYSFLKIDGRLSTTKYGNNNSDAIYERIHTDKTLRIVNCNIDDLVLDQPNVKVKLRNCTIKHLCISACVDIILLNCHVEKMFSIEAPLFGGHCDVTLKKTIIYNVSIIQPNLLEGEYYNIRFIKQTKSKIITCTLFGVTWKHVFFGTCLMDLTETFIICLSEYDNDVQLEFKEDNIIKLDDEHSNNINILGFPKKISINSEGRISVNSKALEDSYTYISDSHIYKEYIRKIDN